MTDPGYNIPAFLLKPVSGPCIHCGEDCEERDEGEWIHQECHDELVWEQREDYRLDDPRHTPYSNLRR